MSHWKSFRADARRLKREAKEKALLRKERRQSALLIIVIGVVSIGLCVADFFWQKHRANQQRQTRHNYQQKGITTAPGNLAQPVSTHPNPK